MEVAPFWWNIQTFVDIFKLNFTLVIVLTKIFRKFWLSSIFFKLDKYVTIVKISLLTLPNTKLNLWLKHSLYHLVRIKNFFKSFQYLFILVFSYFRVSPFLVKGVSTREIRKFISNVERRLLQTRVSDNFVRVYI